MLLVLLIIINFLLLLDLLLSGIWKQISIFQDPELKRLAEQLPRTVLESQANSTTKKYLNAYRWWKDWVQARHLGSSFPVSIPIFALYLQYVGDSTKSRATVNEAVNAVAWFQCMAGTDLVSQD